MYGKIYEQTFTGSMRGAGSHIFAVWSYVIAHTKPDAMVELNPEDVASRLGEELSRVEEAIEHFKSPDPKSRSKEFEGRRLLQKGEFIYFVPQYHRYHGFANNKERREYFAQKKREQRQRDKERQTVKSKVSNNVQQSESESKTNPEEIYRSFPLKVGKPDALKAIRRALLKVPFNTLLEKTKAFASARNGDTEFCPNPATWFNQERFNDDPKTWLPKLAASQFPTSKPKLPAPIYPKLPEKREVTEEELAAQRNIIREEKEKLKAGWTTR